MHEDVRVKVLMHVDARVQREKVGDASCARIYASCSIVSECACAPRRTRAIAAPVAAGAAATQQKGANGGKC